MYVKKKITLWFISRRRRVTCLYKILLEKVKEDYFRRKIYFFFTGTLDVYQVFMH